MVGHTTKHMKHGRSCDIEPEVKMSHEGVANECIGLSAFKTKINEFTEAAKVHSNDDSIAQVCAI